MTSELADNARVRSRSYSLPAVPAVARRRRPRIGDLPLTILGLLAILAAIGSGVYGSGRGDYGSHPGPTPIQIQVCDGQSGPCSWSGQRYRRY